MLAVAVLLFVGTTIVRPHRGYTPLLDVWLYDGIGLLGGLLVAVRARPFAPRGARTGRRAWLLLAAGLLTSSCGDIVSSLLGPDAPTPSLADPLWLAFYPLVYGALVLLLRERLPRLPMAIWLDGVTAALALTSVAAAAVFGPISAATGGSTAALAVGLAYPVGDLLLVGVVVVGVTMLGRRAGVRWALLASGFALFAVADSGYLLASAKGTDVPGSWLDSLSCVAVLLVARASITPARPVSERRASTALLPPLACTVVAVAVLVCADPLNLSRLGVALAAGTVFSVAARLAFTFREVSALAASHGHQAVTDELTGLANRRALLAALEAPGRRAAGLLLVDLDRFKEVNDSLGHHVGDELLRQLSRRLSDAIGHEGVLARLGGDEFAVLMPNVAEVAVAQALSASLIEALADPFSLADIAVHVDASVGIALWPGHCDDVAQLLQCADVAMYRAKSSLGHVAVYDPADDPQRGGRLQTAEDLRTALRDGQLVCHYQPKIRLPDQSVDRVEALVRWRHPTRGLLGPAEFLPLAERTGLMRGLTETVLDAALAQVRRWRDDGGPRNVAVNLSASNLLDADLASHVALLLDRHGLPGQALTLEITESVLMVDWVRARAQLRALHALGIELSIDDYGTGYSSLAYLQELPVDELKIDRAFISRIATDPRSAAIVRSTVELAHSLGLRIVAEGVEDLATLRELGAYGCDFSQGFFHSKPLPAAELADWLAAAPGRQPARAPTDDRSRHGATAALAR